MQIITAAQCRAARALLDWSQPILADKCGLHVQTVSYFEKGAKIPSRKTLEKIFQIFTSEGIVFYDDDGVQRRLNRVVIHHGEEGFRKFIDELYETAKAYGGDICLFNAKPANWKKWLENYWENIHVPRMQALKDSVNFRIIIREGDYNFISHKFAEYRWIPKSIWNENSYYAYGDKIAFLSFENDDVEIFVLHQRHFANTHRFLFNLVWNQLTIIPDKGKYKPDMYT